MEFLDQLNDEKAEMSFSENDKQRYAVYGVVGYILPILFFLPIIIDRDSSYCKFHANQQLTFLLSLIVIGICISILSIIPILGALIDTLLGLACTLAMITLVVGAVKGKAYRIPVVGSMLEIF